MGKSNWRESEAHAGIPVQRYSDMAMVNFLLQEQGFDPNTPVESGV